MNLTKIQQIQFPKRIVNVVPSILLHQTYCLSTLRISRFIHILTTLFDTWTEHCAKTLHSCENRKALSHSA